MSLFGLKLKNFVCVLLTCKITNSIFKQRLKRYPYTGVSLIPTTVSAQALKFLHHKRAGILEHAYSSMNICIKLQLSILKLVGMENRKATVLQVNIKKVYLCQAAGASPVPVQQVKTLACRVSWQLNRECPRITPLRLRAC